MPDIGTGLAGFAFVLEDGGKSTIIIFKGPGQTDSQVDAS